ncbi:MAG: STAS domain-containing protein [Planctomycetota bacterium]|jgi:anti-sigma B factor antagonist
MKDVEMVVQTIGDVTVVDLTSSSILDGLTIQSVGEKLFELVDEQARRKIILDFSEVRLLSSMMLGVLVRLQRRVEGIKGRLVLCGLRPDLMRVFKITQLHKLFEFYRNENEALNSFDVYIG